MTQTDRRSLDQIKRETEQTRAGLTQTVEELRTSVTETAQDIRERISPAAIKAEVSGYIRTRGEQLVEDMTASARRNPLQALAIGVSIGYPLLRIVRAIPLPIIMVGAGVYLAGSKTAKAATQKASDAAYEMSDELMRRSKDWREDLGDRAAAAKSYASEKIDRLNEAVSGGADRLGRAAGTVGDTMSRTTSAAGNTIASGSSQLQDTAASLRSSVTERAADVKDQGLRMAASAADAAREAAANAAAAGKKIASDARDTSLEAMRRARDTASDLGGRAGTTVMQTIEQNPLLVAGAGLVIGAVIASALPRSDLEADVLGRAGKAIKRGAQAAAAQGVEAAKDAVTGVYQETLRQAQAEGLDPDGLSKAANDIGQRVRRVAEAAVTTAFDPEHEQRPQQQSSNASGDRNHG
jgi:hypothetical protein